MFWRGRKPVNGAGERQRNGGSGEPQRIAHTYVGRDCAQRYGRQCERGQRTKVKFTAHKYKNAEMANGKVTYVSADRFNDRMTGQPYYSVLIQIDEGSLKIAGDIKLQAGMPAEVYIEGSKQTPLQYLIDPITSTMRKAGREL